MDIKTAVNIFRQLAAKYKGYPSEHDAINKAIAYVESLDDCCGGECSKKSDKSIPEIDLEEL